MFDYNDWVSNLEAARDALINTEPVDYSPLSELAQPATMVIDEKSTFAYKMLKQTEQLLTKSNEQIEQLKSNYQMLEGLYNAKEQENLESKKEAKKARTYNLIMTIVAIISMLVAIAAWLLPRQ